MSIDDSSDVGSVVGPDGTVFFADDGYDGGFDFPPLDQDYQDLPVEDVPPDYVYDEVCEDSGTVASPAEMHGDGDVRVDDDVYVDMVDAGSGDVHTDAASHMVDDVRFDASMPSCDEVVTHLLECVKACDGMETASAAADLRSVMEASDVWVRVSEDGVKDSVFDDLRALFDVLLVQCVTFQSSTVLVLSDVLEAEHQLNPGSLVFLRQLRGLSYPGSDCIQHLEVLRRRIRRATTAFKAKGLVSNLERGSSDEHVLSKFQALVASPPVKETSATVDPYSRSADQWDMLAEQIAASNTAMRFSSGFPSLDVASTKRAPNSEVFDEPLGTFAPGEFFLCAAGTGHGKSSFSRRVLPAVAADLRFGWGLPDAKVLHVFTEEEAEIVIHAAGLRSNQRNASVASQVIVAKIGASRRRLIKAVYDLVIDADDQARSSGRPITDFLPYVVSVDYIQGIHEEGEGNLSTVSIPKTADLLLRGVCAWDPEMMSEFSGVDFRSYAGRNWPSGMSNHRVVCISYAQLVKQSGDSLFYAPGKSNPAEFAVEDTRGRLWDLREGDYKCPDRSEILGGGQLLNHSTAVLMLHRSKPVANPAIVNESGVYRIRDPRARIIFEKARNGSVPYVPMEFDVQADGRRAQWFDPLGESRLNSGLFDLRLYQQRGDIVIPARPKPSPFRGVTY